MAGGSVPKAISIYDPSSSELRSESVKCTNLMRRTKQGAFVCPVLSRPLKLIYISAGMRETVCTVP